MIEDERERRQLLLMQEHLGRFKNGTIGLPQLVDALEALLGELEYATDDWREDFVNAWGGMEISYAVALDRNLPIPDITNQSIAEYVQELDVLVQQSLRSGGNDA